MIRPAVILAIAVTLVAVPATAEDIPLQEGASRYSFNRVDDGFVRFDRRTGQVALCGARAVGWGCQTMPEERAALENEIARLTQENDALKKRLSARG